MKIEKDRGLEWPTVLLFSLYLKRSAKRRSGGTPLRIDFPLQELTAFASRGLKYDVCAPIIHAHPGIRFNLFTIYHNLAAGSGIGINHQAKVETGRAA